MDVTVDQMARLIARTLEDFGEEVEEKIEQAISDVAEDTLEDLQNNPVIPERTGAYAKGFYLKNVYKGRGKNKGFHKIIVANKKYRVGHLLENGHLTRSGGRTRAYPHWKQAQEIANTLPDKIREVFE